MSKIDSNLMMGPKLDRHQCGPCGAEFSQIEEFVSHKKQDCQGSSPTPLEVNPVGNDITKTLANSNKSTGKVMQRVACLFKEFLLTESEFDLDVMIEKAKNGEKTDLENALQNFLRQHRVSSGGNIKNSETRPLKHNTRKVYLNLLNKWIYEYSGCQVNIKGNYSRILGPNIQKVLTPAHCPIETDQDGYTSAPEELDEQDFPKRCQYCSSSEASVYFTGSSLIAHWKWSHPFQCPKCSNKTSNQTDLRNHFTKKHPKDDVYFCNTCTTGV